MSYIIISCSRKKCDVSKLQACENSISKLRFPELKKYREELIDMLNLKLDWKNTIPAYKLYQGILYSQIEQQNWEKSNVNVIIVSALFGLILHDDKIPYYNIYINSKLPVLDTSIALFWKKANLQRFISPQNDIDLLFNTYRKIFNIKDKYIATSPKDHWKDNYGFEKGKWLNNQLSKL